jgi:threonine/homoserine efflux transporter RhtA
VATGGILEGGRKMDILVKVLAWGLLAIIGLGFFLSPIQVGKPREPLGPVFVMISGISFGIYLIVCGRVLLWW